MHGLTEGRSVRPAVRPGEGNSPTIKPYREYVPLGLVVVTKKVGKYNNSRVRDRRQLPAFCFKRTMFV